MTLVLSTCFYKETADHMDLNKFLSAHSHLQDDVSKLFETSSYLETIAEDLLSQTERISKRSRNKINRKKLMGLIDDAVSIDRKLRQALDKFGEDEAIEYVREASEALSNAVLLLNQAFGVSATE